MIVAWGDALLAVHMLPEHKCIAVQPTHILHILHSLSWLTDLTFLQE